MDWTHAAVGAVELDPVGEHQAFEGLLAAADRGRETELGAADGHVGVRAAEPGHEARDPPREDPVEAGIGILDADDASGEIGIFRHHRGDSDGLAFDSRRGHEVRRRAVQRDRLEMALIENLQRRDLNPLEEARAYRLLLDEFDLAHDELAKRVGKSRSHVSNLLRLLNLDDNVLAAVASCRLSMGHARALAGLTSHSEQKRLAAQVLDRGLSVRALEALISAATSSGDKGKQAAGTRKRRDPNIVAAEEKLKAALGAPIRITGSRGRGKIVIDYVNHLELQRLFELLERSGRQAPPPPVREIRLPGRLSRRAGQEQG